MLIRVFSKASMQSLTEIISLTDGRVCCSEPIKWCHVVVSTLGNKISQAVGNKAKGRISKQVFQEKNRRQIFRKTNIFYPLIRTRNYLCFAVFYVAVWMTRFLLFHGIYLLTLVPELQWFIQQSLLSIMFQVITPVKISLY